VQRLLAFISLVWAFGLLAAPAGARAALPADGSGFGISDADHIPSRSLDQSFQLLRPPHFRFIVPWDVLDDPGIWAQCQDRIARARAAGATEIAISIGPPAAPTDPTVWIDRVSRFVAAFSPTVRWWSPANEPNHSSSGWMSTMEGAAIVAQYSARLSALLNVLQYSARHSAPLTVLHPTDRLLSPDFHDDYGPDNRVKRDSNGDSTVELYVREFLNAGGDLGAAVAWHPYYGVMQQSLESTVDLVDNVLPPGSPHDIWVTEVGALVERLDSDGAVKVAQTPEQQDAQVQFITGPLAAEPRVARISYYHMRDHNPVWDSALVDELGQRRPAWYTWCRARHAGDASHPDCAISGRPIEHGA
jgi:Glycosyl hydrolase catalytic core